MANAKKRKKKEYKDNPKNVYEHIQYLVHNPDEIYWFLKFCWCWMKCKWLNKHTVINWSRTCDGIMDGYSFGDCIVCGHREVR